MEDFLPDSQDLAYALVAPHVNNRSFIQPTPNEVCLVNSIRKNSGEKGVPTTLVKSTLQELKPETSSHQVATSMTKAWKRIDAAFPDLSTRVGHARFRHVTMDKSRLPRPSVDDVHTAQRLAAKRKRYEALSERMESIIEKVCLSLPEDLDDEEKTLLGHTILMGGDPYYYAYKQVGVAAKRLMKKLMPRYLTTDNTSYFLCATPLLLSLIDEPSIELLADQTLKRDGDLVPHPHLGVPHDLLETLKAGTDNGISQEERVQRNRAALDRTVLQLEKTTCLDKQDREIMARLQELRGKMDAFLIELQQGEPRVLPHEIREGVAFALTTQRAGMRQNRPTEILIGHLLQFGVSPYAELRGYVNDRLGTKNKASNTWHVLNRVKIKWQETFPDTPLSWNTDGNVMLPPRLSLSPAEIHLARGYAVQLAYQRLNTQSIDDFCEALPKKTEKDEHPITEKEAKVLARFAKSSKAVRGRGAEFPALKVLSERKPRVLRQLRRRDPQGRRSYYKATNTFIQDIPGCTTRADLQASFNEQCENGYIPALIACRTSFLDEETGEISTPESQLRAIDAVTEQLQQRMRENRLPVQAAKELDVLFGIKSRLEKHISQHRQGRQPWHSLFSTSAPAHQSLK